MNHVTIFPLVESGAGAGTPLISHYLGVMRGQMVKHDTPKPVADRLRQLLVKANVLGVTNEETDAQTMDRSQSIVNRDVGTPPSGRRAMLLEAQAKLSQAGWNQATWGKSMHLRLVGEHEAYQAIQRRVNARPNGTRGNRSGEGRGRKVDWWCCAAMLTTINISKASSFTCN